LSSYFYFIDEEKAKASRVKREKLGARKRLKRGDEGFGWGSQRNTRAIGLLSPMA
jgi:hypothetical protein